MGDCFFCPKYSATTVRGIVGNVQFSCVFADRPIAGKDLRDPRDIPSSLTQLVFGFDGLYTGHVLIDTIQVVSVIHLKLASPTKCRKLFILIV